MQTLRQGSKGEIVKEWQRIIGVDDDGIFGSNTLAATKAWQASKKLVADGVVGPATWSAAGKKVDPSALPEKSASAGTDAWAYAVAKKAAPEMGEAQRQYVLAVARGEGFYGKGWNPTWKPGTREDILLPLNGSVGSSGQRLDVQAARTSNNWGAVQGQGSGGSFMWVDHHRDGSPYVNPYKRYSAPEEGFLSMANIILKGGKRGATGAEEIKNAINRGSLKDAVYAQSANGYFELAPDKYLNSVLRNYNQLTANLGWQDLHSESGHHFLNWARWTIVSGMIGVVGFTAWYLRDKWL